MSRYHLVALGLVLGIALAVPVRGSRQDESKEELARRLFESGAMHMRQAGADPDVAARRAHYDEALRDFTRLTEVFPDSDVADNALLEMSKYYAYIADDPDQAVRYAERILKSSRYSSEDSAADALIVEGDVKMARSRSKADLDAAISSFDRVTVLYPTFAPVPRAQYLSAEAHRLEHAPAEALAQYGQVERAFPTDPVIPKVHIGAGLALVATGEWMAAMEEFQLARLAPAASEDAKTALGCLTTLSRLYLRPAGKTFAPSLEAKGVSKVTDVVSLLLTPSGGGYVVTKGRTLVMNDAKPVPLTVTKARSVGLDRFDQPVFVDSGRLVSATANLSLPDPKLGAGHLLEQAETAVNLRNGDWIVASGDYLELLRYDAKGQYRGIFAPFRASRLALNEFDEIAALDRTGRIVRLFDNTGRWLGDPLTKGQEFQLKNPVDVQWDMFGQLYVLDQSLVAVYSMRMPKGTPVKVYGQPDNNPAAFHASAFAIDRAGRLFIADEHAQQIRIYQ